jgi:hypothetical protein
MLLLLPFVGASRLAMLLLLPFAGASLQAMLLLLPFVDPPFNVKPPRRVF